MKKGVLLVLLAVFLAACAPSAASGSMEVVEPWVRAPGGVTGGAFMLIRNGTAQADRLLSAESDAAETVEIHEMKMENEVMMMREVEGGLEIPAGGTLELVPGGYHIMLINLKQELTPGEKVSVTLNFENSGPITVEAEVKEP